MANNSICSIPDCGKPVIAKGFCENHYRRLLRNGDPLAGRVRNGEPLRYFEEVILAYEGNECLPWPFNKNSAGYGMMKEDGKYHVVSRLVCERIHGPAPTPDHDAAHSCGNGHLSCSTKAHLSWKTKAENQHDRVLHGTHHRGERQYASKLTRVQVREIRSLKGQLSNREIGARFGLHPGYVSLILRKKRWAWLD